MTSGHASTPKRPGCMPGSAPPTAAPSTSGSVRHANSMPMSMQKKNAHTNAPASAPVTSTHAKNSTRLSGFASNPMFPPEVKASSGQPRQQRWTAGRCGSGKKLAASAGAAASPWPRQSRTAVVRRGRRERARKRVRKLHRTTSCAYCTRAAGQNRRSPASWNQRKGKSTRKSCTGSSDVSTEFRTWQGTRFGAEQVVYRQYPKTGDSFCGGTYPMMYAEE